MNPKLRSAVFSVSILLMPVLQAQTDLDYQLPPDRLVRFVDALPAPSVSISNDGRWMLVMESPGLPSIAEVSRPELRLGGLRINPPDKRFEQGSLHQ